MLLALNAKTMHDNLCTRDTAYNRSAEQYVHTCVRIDYCHPEVIDTNLYDIALTMA